MCERARPLVYSKRLNMFLEAKHVFGRLLTTKRLKIIPFCQSFPSMQIYESHSGRLNNIKVSYQELTLHKDTENMSPFHARFSPFSILIIYQLVKKFVPFLSGQLF